MVELPFFHATLFARGTSGRAPAGLSVSASGDKLCGKMREKDPGSKKTVVTTAIQKEVSMRIHGEEKGRAGKREGDRETGVRLMSFAQTVRREANVIYEDRATSQVDEVSRLENF